MSYTLRCTKPECAYIWESNEIQTTCPACDERRVLAKTRRFFYKLDRKIQIEKMHGRSTNDRERLCENDECGKPLAGYSDRDHDAVTGEAFIVCSSCGHEHVIFEEEPSARRLRS